jgi:POT family proton-dependent oligopeptide transporter
VTPNPAGAHGVDPTVESGDETPHGPKAALSWRRARLAGHPAGFWFLFWGELAERSSYYGSRTILLLFMIERLGLGRSTASIIMSYFMAACYLFPWGGALLADRLLGRYWTIVLFSAPYIVGHVLMGIESAPFLFCALTLLAMGSGAVKPNLAPLLGLTYDEKRPGQKGLRTAGFAMFLGAINVGGLLSAVAMPILRTRYGYSTAFLFPAALMATAFFLFALGKPFYASEPLTRADSRGPRNYGRWPVVRRLAGLLAVLSIFWCIADQSATTWILLARDHMDLRLFGVILIEPDQMQALNPLLVLIVLPLVSWGWSLQKRFDARRILHHHYCENGRLRGSGTTDRMLVGFVLTGICMTLMAFAGFRGAGPQKVSVLWEAAACVLITVAEVCISVAGLEMVYEVAPRNMKSGATATFLFSNFLGNLINAQVTPFYSVLGPGWYFTVMAAALVPVTLVFSRVADKLNAAVTHAPAIGSPSP